jgi:hypothetical protein
LILALILVTVVGVVVSVVLTFADTSLRVTVNAARPEAATAATADGAAQVAINTLRNSTFLKGANCFGASSDLSLGSFPSAAAGSSALVHCDPDPGSGQLQQIGPSNKPAEAVLTLGQYANEDGINIKVSSQGTLLVHGGIFSNSNVNVTLGSLGTDTANTWLVARTGCKPNNSAYVGPGGVGTFPNMNCSDVDQTDPRGLDPALANPAGYAAPSSTSLPLRTVPACPKGVGKATPQIDFQPGIYTSASALTNLMSNGGQGCKGAVFHFQPGQYFFDFGTNGGAADKWTISTGTLIAGTISAAASTAIANGKAITMPGSCLNPLNGDQLNLTQPQGVQFFFGGDSQFFLSSAQAEFCGSWLPDAPPLVVYGLKTSVTASAAPGGAIPAGSGCVTLPGYSTNGNSGSCAMIQSDNSPNSQIFFQGTTYAPNAALDISLNNNTAQVFEDGLVARTLWLNPTGSGVPTTPVINLPNDSQGWVQGDTVVYLTVYVCANSLSCTSSSGKLALTTMVDVVDPNPGPPTAGNREVSIKSWVVQR